MKKRLCGIALALFVIFSAAPSVMAAGETAAEPQAEIIGRGAIGAVNPGGGVYLSWRLLENEPKDSVSFNVYKNGALLTNVKNTNYTDNGGAKTDVYNVSAVVGGAEGDKSPDIAILDGYANPGQENAPYAYFDIPVNIPPDGNGATYNAPDTSEGQSGGPNDVSVGDVDGDGIYEIILKWDPSNSRDNSQSGVTGNVYIDCYEYDGTQLWRIDLGRNIRAGAHYTQFQVYDYDGDGKAEVAMRTAPGSKDGSGAYVTEAGVNDTIKKADNTMLYANSDGQIITNPEYLTIFNGETGKAMQTIEYEPARGSASAWGKDSYGGRSERFLAGTAYLDGVHPSMIFARGYYQRSSMVAYDWDGKNLTRRWLLDSGMNSKDPFYGQGNHNLSVADIDNDGKDEIVYGSCAVDDDGTVAHSMGWGHGDALHVSDFDNDGEQEIFAPLEEKPNCGIGFREGSGAEIWHYTSSKDDGRGVMAYFSKKYGVLAWDGLMGIRTIDGTLISNVPKQDDPDSLTSANFNIYWDGDLCAEHFDGDRIQKFNDDKIAFERLLTFNDVAFNNTTKRNPCLQADLFGDWREELILRRADNAALRVFISLAPSDYMFTTFLQDHQYRMAVAWQNTGYNQPPHQSYYIGYDMNLAYSTVTVRTADGSPVNGAEVTAGNKSAVTDQNGEAKFKLAAGEYEVTAEKNGYFTGHGKITVTDETVGTAEIVLVPEHEIGESWDFNDLNDGKTFADGDGVKNEHGAEINVRYGTAALSGASAPSISSRGSGDNYLKLTDVGNGQDGWFYSPEAPIDCDKQIFEFDFMLGETTKGAQLLRVLDANNVPETLAYSGTDGRAFDIMTGDNGSLKFTDYLSKGSSDTAAKESGISGITISPNKWYSLRAVYTRADDKVKVYAKDAAADEYNLCCAFTLGSTSPKGAVPKLSPTKVLTNTRGSDKTNLSIDNIFIGTVTEIPSKTDYPYTVNDVSVSGGVTVNVTKNYSSGNEKDVLIAAAYDKESGALTSWNSAELVMNDGETKDIAVDISSAETDEVSVYIWNGFDEIKPLANKNSAK